VRDEPGIHSVLVGTGNIEHLRSNARTFARPPLSDAIRKRITGWLPAGRRAMPAQTLHAKAVDQYNATGYFILRQVFDEKLMRQVADEADRLWRWQTIQHADNMRSERRDSIDGTLINNKLDPVLDLSPLLCEIARHPMILGAAMSTLGETPVLLKDKLIFKPPGHPGFKCHQDYRFWEGFAKQIVTLALAIDGGDKHNGALQVFRGRHRKGLLNKPDEMFLTDQTIPHRFWRRRIDTQPGDVVVFHCMIPHQSGPNRTTLPRRTLNLTYAPQSQAGRYLDYYEHLAKLRRDVVDASTGARLHYEPPVHVPW
jgi:ectoine hydroxylase-related dioxygenase (phytanoyl-CoA dioxygenase family)